MTKPKSKTPTTRPLNKSRTLHLPKLPPGVTQDRMKCDMVSQGLVANAMTTVRFGSELGELSLTDMLASLQASGEAVNRGDLSAAERMLNAQAATLNAIFAEMARVAQLNIGHFPDSADRYLRLALRAQSQSRATVETLAAIKNPPIVYARQMNVANGPQQVVNNGATPAHTLAAGGAGAGGSESLALPEPETALCPTRGISPLFENNQNAAPTHAHAVQN